MATRAQQCVVIVYEHALLGEGIAKYLRAQIGVEATLASTGDPEAVRSALALAPAVVIFESSDPPGQLDLSTLAPRAVLIDVSTVISRGSVLTPSVAGLEQILQAVRDSGSALREPSGTTREVGSALREPSGTTRESGSALREPSVTTRGFGTSASGAR